MGIPPVNIYEMLSGNLKSKEIFTKRRESIDVIQSLIQDSIIGFEIYKQRLVIVLSDGRKYNWRMNSLEDNNFTVLITTGTYDKDEECIVKKMIQPDDIVMDIGANKGWYTVLFSKLAYSGAVYAFEPVPSAYSELLTNLKLNNCTNVKTFNLAVYDKEQTTKIYIPYHHSTLASLRKTYDTEYETSDCQTTTINAIINDNQISRIDFMKIDAEGAEEKIIKGGESFFLSEAAPTLMVELFDRLLSKFETSARHLTTFLEGLGYRLYIPRDGYLYKYSSSFISSSDLICIKNANLYKYPFIV